jgi:hypothetical protein
MAITGTTRVFLTLGDPDAQARAEYPRSVGFEAAADAVQAHPQELRTLLAPK